jgi:hypothetical protein
MSFKQCEDYFVLVINFKVHILHESKLLQAHFNRIAAPGSKYFVEVTANDTIVARFEMQKDASEKWKVLRPVHDWVLTLENQLAHAIYKNNVMTPVKP